MLSTHGGLATPAPSSEYDVPSSPTHKGPQPRHDLATPPPSSPTAATKRALATTPSPVHAIGVSPTKRAQPPPAQRARPTWTMRISHDQSVPLDYTHTFVVGRCRQFERTSWALRGMRTFMGTRPLALLSLPPSAKHASRVHALIRWVPFSSPEEGGAPIGTFVLRVMGQNGLLIHDQRYRAGQVVRLEPGTTCLDFFGMRMHVEAPIPMRPAPPARPHTDGTSPTKAAPADVPSSPPRWAPAWAAPTPGEAPTTSEAHTTGEALTPGDAPTTSKAPTSGEAPTTSEAPTSGEAPTPGEAPTTDAAPASPRAASATSPLDTARRLVEKLAPTYDLAGLLAGAIVFHRTATISASEAVRSVLATNPSMLRGEAGACAVAFSPSKRRLLTEGRSVPAHGERIHGWHDASEHAWLPAARQAWYECLDCVLQRAPMFGVIQRPGKDTRGNPLECWYYYDKEHDPDRERALNLGAFAKPMRNAVRSQKPIFWKKSEYVRATSNGYTSDDDKIPYSPRSDETRPRKRRAKAEASP